MMATMTIPTTRIEKEGGPMSSLSATVLRLSRFNMLAADVKLLDREQTWIEFRSLILIQARMPS